MKFNKILLGTLLASACGFGASAQVKVGSNPTTINGNANLQVEATNGSQVIIQKDNGNLGVGTLTPAEKLTVTEGNGLFTNTGNFSFSRYTSAGGITTQIGSSAAGSTFGAGGFVGTTTNDPINFLINNAPKMRLTGNEFVPNGSNLVDLGSATDRWKNIYGFRELSMTGPGEANVYARFTSGDNVITQIGSSNSTTNFGAGAFVGTFSDHQVNFIANNLTVARLFSNAFVPGGDNTISLGSGVAKWSLVWSQNGTIQTSDRRLKTNIKPIAHGLADVMKLEAVSFDWKDKTNTKLKLGFIAQDFQKVVPELVTGSETGENYLGLNYAELTPVLVKAIQEQQAMIEALKNENKYLKATVSQIDTMKDEMATIKNLLTQAQSKEVGK